MNCHVCNKTIYQVTNNILHRANPLGETPALWICYDCCSDKQKEEINKDNFLKDITNSIKEIKGTL